MKPRLFATILVLLAAGILLTAANMHTPSSVDTTQERSDPEVTSEFLPFWKTEMKGQEVYCALIGPRAKDVLYVSLLRADTDSDGMPLMFGSATVGLATAHDSRIAAGSFAIGVRPIEGLLWEDVKTPDDVVLVLGH